MQARGEETRDGATQSALVLVVMNGGTSLAHPLPRGEVTIGRDETCVIPIDDPKASRTHLVLRVGDGPVTASDPGSRNGSFLGSRRLPVGEPVPLDVGDILRVGSTLLLLKPAPGRERVRLVGEGSLGARMVTLQSQGGSFWLLEAALRLPKGARAATWNDEDAELQGAVVRLDAVVDEHVDATASIAETGPARRSILLLGADMAAAQAAAKRLEVALTLARVDAEVRILEGFNRPSTSPPTAPPSPAKLGEEMTQLTAMIGRVAAGHLNVLIVGETGVGKEVLAHALHARSNRAAGPLVCLNCAAFSETLLESELFGYEKGAFTGAVRDKPGLIESANGGIVFLDEIGEMPLTFQVKLLRVLEKRESQRVGSLRPRPIDVRFFAATNRDLEAEVRAKRFRRDLYFRLNGVTLTIPPLRRRLDEIAGLATQFLAEAAAACRRPAPALSAEALEGLRAYDWPGNIRELRNVLDRAVMLCQDDSIRAEHLGFTGGRRALSSLAPSAPPPAADDVALAGDDAGERARIVAALEKCAGNQTHAAELLGVSRGTLIKRLAKYGVPRPRPKAR